MGEKQKGGPFLKVAEKEYPSGHACDAGNSLTLGGATSGKVHTYFTWSGSLPPTGLGSAHCVGCSAMCVGTGAANGTQLAACASPSTSLVARAWSSHL